MKTPMTAHVALLAMVVIGQSTSRSRKIALAHVTPLQFNVLRFPMAALLLYVVLKARDELELPSRAELPRVLALGILGNLCYQLLHLRIEPHDSEQRGAAAGRYSHCHLVIVGRTRT